MSRAKLKKGVLPLGPSNVQYGNGETTKAMGGQTFSMESHI